MSMSLSIHNVTAIRLTDRAHSGHEWAHLTLVSTNPFDGKETEFEITAFPADGTKPLRVEQPEDEPEDDEPMSYTAYRDSLGHTESQRQDIRDAGRGHLLP